MGQYRKTALVEAEQFFPPHSIPAGCYQAGGVADVAAGHGEWRLRTLEGEHDLRPGDYICTGSTGEKWNVERSIFEATYEPADQILALTTPAGMDEAREALERIADGDEPRPLGASYFPDKRPSKHDQCAHGIWMYETCGNCIMIFAREALSKGSVRP